MSKKIPLKIIAKIPLFPTGYNQIINTSGLFGVNPDEAVLVRRRYLYNARDTIRFEIKSVYKQISKARTELERKCRVRRLQEYLEFMKKIKWETQKLDKDFILTEDTFKLRIEQAKAVPIETLLPNPIVHERTNCPFHDDRKRSMLVRNGFAWCFRCNRGWDGIDYIMEMEKLEFKQAVDVLCLNGEKNEKIQKRG